MTVNLEGRLFGRLTVLDRTDQRKNGSVVWRCECICNTIINVQARSLNAGNTQSCGCLHKETVSKQFTKHGATKEYTRHPLHIIWINMKARCNNPKNSRYAYYGGRGITICDEWKNSYTKFRDYMLTLPNCPAKAQIPGARLEREIDRYPNNDGNYEPGNVRWATDIEQAQNKSNTITVKINGHTWSLREAVDRFAKVSYNTVRYRIKNGWSTKDAFLKPT